MNGVIRAVAVLAAVTTLALWATPQPAAAFSPAGVACKIGGLFSGLIGKACTLATHAGRIIGAGKKLLGGNVGGALGTLTGSTTVTRTAAAAAGLTAIVAAVGGGARYLLKATAHLINSTTTPQLRTTWFSASYWRMAGIASLLTLPFLFAAAIQAIVRGDAAMLARAAFGYLPLAMLAIGVAAPLTMLLLAASDEMSALIAGASGQAPAAFLDRAGGAAGVTSAVTGSLFPSFIVGLFTAVAAIALWVELLTRQVAVYVIVLMLPLFFAALVWPARRVWAARAVEVLVALILSKFAIVAVLALGGAALDQASWNAISALLAGGSLVLLACFSPWALMRLLPLHELAGAAAGSLRGSAGVLPGIEAGAGALAEVAEIVVARRLSAVGQGGRGDGAVEDARTTGASASGDVEEPAARPAARIDTDAGPATTRPAQPSSSATETPPYAAEEPADRTPAERLPGMGPEFQVENGVWREENFAGDDSGAPLIDPPPGPPLSEPPLPEPPLLGPPPPEPPAPPETDPGPGHE